MGRSAEGDPLVVPGVIHGLRSWTLIRDGASWRLGSVGAHSLWPSDRHIDAVCTAGRDHPAPAPGCTCGVHARHPFGEPASEFAEELREHDTSWALDDYFVHGVIEAWGPLEIHHDGFRAAHGRVAAFFDPYGEGTLGSSLHALARSYGSRSSRSPARTN